ncbi:nucleotidyltransferase domain-containing protein [Candidatus Bathyarchaeota archaeon]|nr:nucleotidyltransferase domain-containing protein [Candidatus Bathyarchaeota archaeon]
MDKLFGSKTRVRVITELVMNPMRAFYIRELSRELGIPYGMVYREIGNLAELGIITLEKRGKITVIHVNMGLPYLSDLRNMVLKTTGVSHMILEKISSKDGILFMLVFGSMASGEYAEGSDIDLMVIGNLDEELLLSAAKRIEEDTGRDVNYMLWGEDEFREKAKAGHHLLLDIVEKPLIMLVGSEDEFRGAVKAAGHKQGPSG